MYIGMRCHSLSLLDNCPIYCKCKRIIIVTTGIYYCRISHLSYISFVNTCHSLFEAIIVYNAPLGRLTLILLLMHSNFITDAL